MHATEQRPSSGFTPPPRAARGFTPPPRSKSPSHSVVPEYGVTPRHQGPRPSTPTWSQRQTNPGKQYSVPGVRPPPSASETALRERGVWNDLSMSVNGQPNTFALGAEERSILGDESYGSAPQSRLSRLQRGFHNSRVYTPQASTANVATDTRQQPGSALPYSISGTLGHHVETPAQTPHRGVFPPQALSFQDTDGVRETPHRIPFSDLVNGPQLDLRTIESAAERSAAAASQVRGYTAGKDFTPRGPLGWSQVSAVAAAKDVNATVQKTTDGGVKPEHETPRLLKAQPCQKPGHEAYLSDIYCNKSDTLCCLVCLKSDPSHRKHECKAVQPAPDHRRHWVGQWVSEAKEQAVALEKVDTQLTNHIASLEHHTKLEADNMIATIEDIQRKLEDAKAKIRHVAASECQANIQRLRGAQEEIQQYRVSIMEGIAESSKLVSSACLAEVMHLQKFIVLTGLEKDEHQLPTTQVRFKLNPALQSEQLIEVQLKECEPLMLPSLESKSLQEIEKSVAPFMIDLAAYS